MDGTRGAALVADPDFDGKSPGDVFDLVKEYGRPDPFLSKDAADAFEGYVRDNPSECSKRAPGLGSAHPRIQRGLFLGLREAVKDGERIEWDGVLHLIKGVVLRFEQNRSRLGESAPETESLRSALLPLFWLVEDGFKENSVDYGLRNEARGVLEDLVRIGSADGEYEEYPGRTGALDMSLNNLNGASFHALYHYASWCRTHDENLALVPEAKRIFEQYLDGDDHTASRHAVLGIFLPGLYYLDQEWARRLPPRITPHAKTRIAFWDGYVSGRQMYSYAFEDLWEWYDEFMNGPALQNPDLARAHENTVERVMSAYFYDWPNADIIVEKFLEKGDAEAIERCVRQAGPVLAGKRDDPDFNKARLADLWRHPSLKNHNLDAWFMDTPLDDEEAITLYRDHITQYPSRISGMYNPVYKLAEYAEGFPLQVAECLDVLIRNHEGSVVPDEACKIWETLRRSKDPRVEVLCKEIKPMLRMFYPHWNGAGPAARAS